MRYFTKTHMEHVREKLTPEEFSKKMEIVFDEDEIYFDMVFNYPGIGYINRCFTSIPEKYNYEVVLEGMSPQFENLDQAEEVLLQNITESKRSLIENITFEPSSKSPAQDPKLCKNAMPTLNKNFTLTVTPEQFLAACSDLEVQELDLLLGPELKRRKLLGPDNSNDIIGPDNQLPTKN